MLAVQSTGGPSLTAAGVHRIGVSCGSRLPRKSEARWGFRPSKSPLPIVIRSAIQTGKHQQQLRTPEDFHLPDSPSKAKLPVIGSRIRVNPADQAAVTEAMGEEKRDWVEEKGVTATGKNASDMTVSP